MHKVYYIVVSPRFFRFRVEELGEGERRWSHHDTGGDEGGRVDAEVDVGGQHGAGDRSEAARHHSVDLGPGDIFMRIIILNNWKA